MLKFTNLLKQNITYQAASIISSLNIDWIVEIINWKLGKQKNRKVLSQIPIKHPAWNLNLNT